MVKLAMDEGDHYQLDDSAPELYQRYLARHLYRLMQNTSPAMT